MKVCKEKHRFEKLMEYFRYEDGNIDFMVGEPLHWTISWALPCYMFVIWFLLYFMFLRIYQVACMQFINIVVHSVEDMNFRVHLQYEFTKLGLDDFLEVMIRFHIQEFWTFVTKFMYLKFLFEI